MNFLKKIKQLFIPPKEENHTDEYDKRFHLWAYGTSHKLACKEKMKYWNLLHGEELMLSPSGSIEHDIIRMHDLFDKHLVKLDVEANLYKARNEI
jgi:hypothetical protein